MQLQRKIQRLLLLPSYSHSNGICRYGNPISGLPDGTVQVTMYPVEANFTLLGARVNLTLEEASLSEYQAELQKYMDLAQKALKAASVVAKEELALGAFDVEQQAFRLVADPWLGGPSSWQRPQRITVTTLFGIP
jgi:hypothetical protein